MRWSCLVVLVASCHRTEPHQLDASTTGAATSTSTVATGVDVLFIGNSYTFVNDLPAMVGRLVASGTPPVSLKSESVTVGGASLRTLWESTDARARIEQGRHRFVVIQGQSVEPCTDRDGYVTYARRFAELAVAHGAQPVLYATWPRRAGDGFYLDARHPRTQEAMATCLRDGAIEASTGTTMTIANVRDAWLASLAGRPELALYAADGSHPSTAGTFLAANVLARILAPGSTKATWHPAEIREVDAVYLAAAR